jgi:outer membrane protein assembly factor BamB
LLALVGPISTVQPVPVAAQDEEGTGELTELWSYEPSDALFHDPKVSDGVVLAASEDSVVHAVDAETGKGLWQTSTLYLTSGPYMEVEGSLLLTLSAEPLRLNALDVTPEGSEERWSVELDAVPESSPPSVTEDGLVIVLIEAGSGEQVVAFDINDGSEQWRAEAGAFIYTTGYLYADGIVVVGTDEGLAGLDAATGEERWAFDIDGRPKDLVASDGVLFGAILEAEDLFAVDLATGEELWRVAAPTAYNFPLAAGAGLVFVDHMEDVDNESVHAIMALDAQSGDEQYTIMSATGDISGAVVQEGLLYLAANDSVGQDGAIEIYALEDGRLIARTLIDAHGIAVEGNAIYAPTYNGGNEILLHAFTFTQGESGSDGESAATGESDALDLAAMALTPWDLADAGLENYGHGYSEMVPLELFAAGMADARGMPGDEMREQLEEMGFLRAYYAYFYSPAEDEDISQTIVSYVLEFGDEDGAAAAWDSLEDESDLDDTEDIDGFDDFGDASEATLSSGEDSVTGDPFAQLDVSTQLGNLHTGITIIDWNNDEPDEDLAAELIGYAVEQVENGLNADQPALSNLVPRLSGDTVLVYYDAYALREGEAIWFSGETPDTADAQLDRAGEAGWTEEYRIWQRLASWSDDPADSVWSYVSLLRFQDAAAAEAWVEAREEVVEDDERFSDSHTQPVEYGDTGFTYSARSTDGVSNYRGITFQLGEIVAVLDLSGPAMPTEDAIEAMTDEQITCIEDAGCLEPIEIPAAVDEYVAETEAGAEPNDEETPEADETPDAEETPEEEETEQAAGGPVIYESELYDFAITFDLNEWQFTPEDDPTGDEYEWLTFNNDVSTVWMVADPDFDDDELGDCVEYYIESQGWADSWEMEPLDELVVEDGRAVATFTLVNVFGLFGYLSVECRAIDSNTALAIMHFAGTDAEGEIPDEEIEQVQALVDGIQISGSASDDGGSDADEDQEDEAASGASGEVYTSEQWGYSVTWDPEYWAATDADLEDGIRLGFQFNTLASISIFRIESEDGDASSCLNGIIAQANEGNDDSESELIAADDLPVPETAGDAAGGVYMLGDFATMYFECRPLADGMLRIAFGAPDENWEELLPYLEEVLTGIEITTG